MPSITDIPDNLLTDPSAHKFTLWAKQLPIHYTAKLELAALYTAATNVHFTTDEYRALSSLR
jgi:hypothetical protein